MKKAKSFGPPKSSNKKFTKKRLYDTGDWVEYRNRFLAANPDCYSCGARARVVDHIVAFKGKEELFWNETNYIPLCLNCHNQITGFFDQFNPPKTEEKLKWINNNRLKNQVSLKVKVVRIKLN